MKSFGERKGKEEMMQFNYNLKKIIKNICLPLYYAFKYLFACVYIYHVHPWCQWKPKTGTGSLGTGKTGGGEALCVFSEKNPGPPQEQSVLITIEYLSTPPNK